MSELIHPTAVIDPSAKLGKGVRVGPYSVIEHDVVIGDDCFIDSHVKIAHHTTVGPRCRFYLGALVGEDPQDHRFKEGTLSSTEIGSDTTIREYVTIHRSPFEGGITKVGSHTLLMAFVHVGHDCDIGNYVTCANHTAISGHVKVYDGAVLSGYIMIHQFCRLGELVMMSPGTKIRQDIPPFCMLSENGWICGCNVVGMRRAGLNQEQRKAIHRANKIFFFRGLNTPNAVAEIQKEPVTPEVQKFIDFVLSTKRGIVPPEPAMLKIGTHHSSETETEEEA